SVEHVIAFDELDALRERGRAYAAEHPAALQERADAIGEDDLFTFIYTSGTTGPPKACMIRNRNYYAMVQKGDEMEDRLIEPGDRVSRLRQARQPVPRALLAQHALADRLVYRKVKERLGGRLRVANAGGAPLSRDIAEFFHAIDILILEGYGLSEVTTAATVNRKDDFKFGTVGKPLPGVEIRIAEDGEILIRSNTVFAGYYRDPEATAE